MSVALVLKMNRSSHRMQTKLIKLWNTLNRMGPPEHAWDALTPGTEFEQALQAERRVTERDMVQSDLQNNADMGPRSNDTSAEFQARYTKELQKSSMSSAEYISVMRKLNTKQRDIVMVHHRWCKDVIIALKSIQPQSTYHIFLSGPGGVGKSHVIKLIHCETNRLLKLSGMFEPQELTVLLMAFTGTAALGINGVTLHSAYNFSIGPHNTATYKSPKNDTLNTCLN